MSAPTTTNIATNVHSLMAQFSKSGLPSTESPLSQRPCLDTALCLSTITSQQPRLTEAGPAPPSSPPRIPSPLTPTAIESLIVHRKHFTVPVPDGNELIEDTAQLVYCARLLDKARIEAGSTWPPPPSTDLLSKTQDNHQEWIQYMEENPLEKDHISNLTRRMASKFLAEPTDDPDIIREVVLIGPLLERDHHRQLVMIFVQKFQRSALLDINLLLGLAQLTRDRPANSLSSEDLIRIIKSLRMRLEEAARKDTGDAIHLTFAISIVLTTLATCLPTNQSRVELESLFKILSALRKHKDPLIKYQARYGWQLLLSILDPRTVDGGPVLNRGMRSLYQRLRNLLQSFSRKPWFQDVQNAKGFVQRRLLTDFYKLFCQGPGASNTDFQWHVCQLLGELSMNPTLDDATRHRTLIFLLEFAKGKGVLNSGPVVRRWAWTILQHISEQPVTSASTCGSQGICNEAVMEKKQGLILSLGARTVKPFNLAHPLTSRLSLPTTSPLLHKVNTDPDIEFAIDRLLRQQSRMYDRRAIYIQLLSKQNIRASEDLVELQVRAREFLASKRKVLLVLGDSGAGKSTFGRRLEDELWRKYKPGGPVPLFIDLKTIDPSDKDMIRQHLEDLGLFTDQQIEDLRQSRQFILICDGYDEYHHWTNLHSENHFNRPRNWKVKMIVSCRTQYLGPNYRNYFEPDIGTLGNPNFSNTSDQFEEAVIVSFRSSQIKEYVELFTQALKTEEYLHMEPAWSMEQYMGRLRSIRHLMELAASPFMLKMILDVLPRVAETTTKMTRVELYDRFVELHFESEHRRLSQQHSSGKMNKDVLSAFTLLKTHELIDLGLDFSKRLSHFILKDQKGMNSVSYSDVMDGGTWKNAFFGPDGLAKLLRQSAPLVCRENRQDARQLIRHRFRLSRKRNSYEFSHRSMLEYFYSCLIFDPRGHGTCLDLAKCLESSAHPEPIVHHPLGQVNIVSELSIVQFLAERVADHDDFKHHLQAIVQMSKAEAAASQAASNSITILVQAGVNFNGADLAGIRIPGADLTGGQFDSVCFQGADLTHTNLAKTWLRRANFAGAQMKDVWLGEKSFLTIPTLRSLTASRDGKKVAIGLDDGIIVVYDTQDWQVLSTLKGHSQRVSSLAFSNNSEQLASGSFDKTVRVWCVETGSCVHTFEGLSHRVTFVVFSPDGLQVAAVYHRNTVRIWDAHTGASGPTVNVSRTLYNVRIQWDQLVLEYEEGCVMRWDLVSGAFTRFRGLPTSPTSMAWSPDGRQIAFGSRRGTIKLWSRAMNEFKTLSHGRHDDALSLAFAYSPDGTRLVTGCHYTLYLWDLQAEGNNAVVMEKHTSLVHAAVLSKDGRWVASYDLTGSVILWDGQSGSCLATMDSHIGGVCGVAFLNENELLSGGRQDETVRFWQLDDEAKSRRVELSDAHIKKAYVIDTAYHPTGKYLVTSEYDGSIRRWDAETGASQVFLNLGPGNAYISYSSDGQRLAVSTVNKVVIYDTSKDKWQPIEELEGECLVEYSSCGSRVAIATSTGEIKLRALLQSTGGDRVLKGPVTRSLRLTFSSNGEWLASVNDRDVWVWDLTQVEAPKKFNRSDCVPHDSSFSPCSNTLAIAYTLNISLVDVRTGEERIFQEQRPLYFHRIAWSHCGRWIVASSANLLVLWETDPQGKRLELRKVEMTEAGDLEWSPSTPMEVVIALGTSVSVWRMEEDEHENEALTRLCLVWGSFPNRLVAKDAVFTGAIDLKPAHRTVLLQYGSIDEFGAMVDGIKALLSILTH
ncbi:hypothetical protein EMPS_00085 [Entomortierella parvispora]|uniref:NACHT domain-containing protein n=1 Tax=Entomortierella parvispora TaxID=205924 RepID=A0A9P3GZ83_9FUNG|nr:hypothetical protein EMPS_00085 [Entomortierella parvispora]